MELMDLPVDVLIVIFKHLTIKTLCELSLVCSYINNVINEPNKYLGRKYYKYQIDGYTLIYDGDIPIKMYNNWIKYTVDDNKIIESGYYHTAIYSIDGYLESTSAYSTYIFNINKVNVDKYIQINNRYIYLFNGPMIYYNLYLFEMHTLYCRADRNKRFEEPTILIKLQDLVIDFCRNMIDLKAVTSI